MNQVLDLTNKIIVDLFAGGGGVSEGVEMALGYPPHVAVNHSETALSMHRMNHPFTRHHIADVFEICPKGVVAFHRRPVAVLHLSPDCTHHSQARGGQPRNGKIRALSWVAIRWAGQVRPDSITLENVKQIKSWGPLIAKRDTDTGRVVKLDGSVAEPGERVPVCEQFLVPDKKRAGQTWRRFFRMLEELGYEVQTKVIVAADLGSSTTRERFYMIARSDGKPIVWPANTHSQRPAPKGKQQWKSAADCIDWTIECPSIFTRKKPLAAATMRRIAKGMVKYVLNAAEPFIVPIAHYNGSDTTQSTQEPLRTITAFPKGGAFSVVSPTIIPATHQGSDRVHDPKKPLPTITAAHRGELMACAATLIQAAHGDGKPNGKKRWGAGCRNIKEPVGTITASGGHAIASAYMMQANGGFNTNPGHDLRKPMSTITNTGSQQQVITAFLARQFGRSIGQDIIEPSPTTTAGGGGKTAIVTAHLTHLRGNCDARDLNAPLQTISAGGQHHGIVEYTLAPQHEEGALQVAAFLLEFYSDGDKWSAFPNSHGTITTQDLLALVTVIIEGIPYVIVDIGLRMLTPRELYRAQGFRDSYIIDRGHDGRTFTKDQQVRMVGNSVPPDVIEAIYRANFNELAIRQTRKASSNTLIVRHENISYVGNEK